MHLVISCSLKPTSRSRVLARVAVERLRAADQAVSFVDLAETPLPLCDDNDCYGDANAQRVTALVTEARGVLLATPVYNYDTSAATKNLVELTGRAWTEKIVGFLCAAGGTGSYMSVMSLANSLMLDFRCLIIPRFVYATGKSFAEQTLRDPKVEARLDELTTALVKLTRALDLDDDPRQS